MTVTYLLSSTQNHSCRLCVVILGLGVYISLPDDFTEGPANMEDEGDLRRHTVFLFFFSAFHSCQCHVPSSKNCRDFADGPVAKTSSSHWRGPGFHSWSGNQIPYSATEDLVCHMKISYAATKTLQSQTKKLMKIFFQAHISSLVQQTNCCVTNFLY